MDPKVEDEGPEGALSIAESPNPKELLTIHLITISNMLKIEVLIELLVGKGIITKDELKGEAFLLI